MPLSLPAEWHQQSAVLLTWPHADTDWQPWLADIETTYTQLVAAIIRFELVVIACHNKAVETSVLKQLSELELDLSRVRTFIAPCNDTWARDHGPITITNEQGQHCICDFTFNAWGDKYQSSLDDLITTHLIQQEFCQLQQYQNIDLILEGGSIESDGRGSLLTTEICLLNPNRNNDMDKAQLEQALIEVLGVEQVLWLQYGHLPGDDTDAHIDTLARFSPDGIVYVSANSESDEHFDQLSKMEQEIAALKDAEGQAYQLYPLPMPAPIHNQQGEPLPATYANYLVINGAVLVPVYNDAQDDNALAVIARAYPGREIIAIDCRTVIEQFGSLHCLTMQLPKDLII